MHIKIVKLVKYLSLMLLIALFCNSLAFARSENSKIIMSYWSNGKRYSPYPIPGSLDSKGRLQTNYDLTGKLNLINTLVYAFLQVDKSGNIYFSHPKVDLSKNDLDTFCKVYQSACRDTKSKIYLGNFDAFSKLDNKSKYLKKMISIGGAGSQISFNNAINHPRRFIESANAIIKAYNLNGIDLDFELYSLFTKDQADRYAQLIHDLRKKLGAQYLITIEMPADSETLHSIGRNNWAIIAKNAYVSIMGYEFHSYLYPPDITANNSNLYNDPNEPSVKGFYHISDDQAVKYLTYLGVPVNKIILGYPAYFQAYGGVSVKNNGLYQPFNPKLTPSFDFGKGKGSYAVMQMLLKEGFVRYTIFMNGKISAVYAYNLGNQQWISFENEKSVAAKARYVVQHHLAGIMMWNIKQDLPADNPKSLLSSVYHVISEGIPDAILHTTG